MGGEDGVDSNKGMCLNDREQDGEYASFEDQNRSRTKGDSRVQTRKVHLCSVTFC